MTNKLPYDGDIDYYTCMCGKSFPRSPGAIITCITGRLVLLCWQCWDETETFLETKQKMKKKQELIDD